MIEVAGEVADGFIAHPFATRRSLERHVFPALARGLARAGRTRAEVDVVCATIVVTAERADELARIRRAVKKQLAFYGSTPAYRPTLDCEGYDDLHAELNRLSKAGRWDDMTDLIDDALLDAVAVVRPRAEVAQALVDRLGDLADGVSLTNNRAPDPTHWADVVAALRRGRPRH
jgi:probable F420-dependent oxidoreductase